MQNGDCRGKRLSHQRRVQSMISYVTSGNARGIGRFPGDTQRAATSKEVGAVGLGLVQRVC